MKLLGVKNYVKIIQNLTMCTAKMDNKYTPTLARLNFKICRCKQVDHTSRFFFSIGRMLHSSFCNEFMATLGLFGFLYAVNEEGNNGLG